MRINLSDNNGTSPSVFKKIDPSDLKFNPVQVYKTFTFQSGSFDITNYTHLPLKGLHWNVLPAMSGSTVLPGWLSHNGYPTELPQNVDNSYQFNIYNSIYHLFYKHKNEPSKTLGLVNLEKASRFLHKSASIFSIPQPKFGLKIKPSSFIYSGSSAGTGLIYGTGKWGVGIYGTSISVNLSCDKYENIFDTLIDTSSYATDVKFYEGFNTYFDTSRITMYASHSGVSYVNGVEASDGNELSIGLAAYFSGSGYLEKKYEYNNITVPGAYDRDNDYAISFYIKSGSNTSTTNELIIAKRKNPDLAQSLITGEIDGARKYPFCIELSGSNQLVFSAANDSITPNSKAEITSSTAVNSGWTNVVCQKSGSYLQMYIGGTLHSSASNDLLLNSNDITSPFTASLPIHNNETLKIGGYSGSNGNGLHGYLDEIRIYNKALSTSEITSLADHTEGGSLLQTNKVGNIFYNSGIVVISSADYRYDDVLEFGYTASYQSTKNIYEFSTICKINSGDFNSTSNPSSTKSDGYTYLNYITGSSFNPYLTTVGLYNDNGELLALGKLANPIKKRDDVDMNILIRIDLDKPKPEQQWKTPTGARTLDSGIRSAI